MKRLDARSLLERTSSPLGSIRSFSCPSGTQLATLRVLRCVLLPLCLCFGSPALAQEGPPDAAEDPEDDDEAEDDAEDDEKDEAQDDAEEEEPEESAGQRAEDAEDAEDDAENEAEDDAEEAEAGEDEADALGETEKEASPVESQTAVEPDEEEKAEQGPSLPTSTSAEEGAEAEREANEPPPPADVLDRAEEATEAAEADVPTEGKPSLLPLEPGASFFVRPEVREGYDDLGVSRARFQEGDQTVFRARLSLRTNSLQLTDDIGAHAYFAPQASGQFGTSGIGGTIGEANLGIYEGYFRLTSERLDFTAGRFAMDYGEAMVIGNLDWHQAARAFDGLHAHYKMNRGYVDFFGTQIAEGWPAVNDPLLAGDTYFWGAYAGLGALISESTDLDAYLLGLSAASSQGLVDPATGATFQRDGATLFHLGLRFKQAFGMVDYRLEGGVQLGETVGAVSGATAPAVETFAYHADAQLGVAPVEGMRIALGGLVASGDDPDTPENEAYSALFPTGHKFLGLMDVFGSRTNAGSGYLKFNMGLTDSLVFKLDGHLFTRLESDGLGQVMGSTDNLAGGEIDTQLVQKIGKWFSVRGLYGIFLPNQAHYGTDEPAHYVEIQGGLNY